MENREHIKKQLAKAGLELRIDELFMNLQYKVNHLTVLNAESDKTQALVLIREKMNLERKFWLGLEDGRLFVRQMPSKVRTVEHACAFFNNSGKEYRTARQNKNNMRSLENYKKQQAELIEDDGLIAKLMSCPTLTAARRLLKGKSRKGKIN
ncbi:MAG: hypothetical protein HQK54_04135 [Oligoflexales bacterium]|nr:hypothetical protein [Oligoflexales bacterium]